MDEERTSLGRPTRFVVYWLTSEQFEAERGFDRQVEAERHAEEVLGTVYERHILVEGRNADGLPVWVWVEREI